VTIVLPGSRSLQDSAASSGIIVLEKMEGFGAAAIAGNSAIEIAP
jgi:hypothetical protein